MPRGVSVAEAIERRRRERDIVGDRLVDLRLLITLDDAQLLAVGDRWDRRLADYDGEATRGMMIRIHPGQLRAVEWFAAWLDAHEQRRIAPPAVLDLDADTYQIDTDPTHVYSALFAGGRRAGKTWVAVVLAVAYALRFPDAIVWLVSPNDEKHDEIRRYVTEFVPAEWVDHETHADGWDLCNGSRLLLKSAYNAEGLKEGKAHLVILNEGQMMTPRAFTVARGAIVDSSGLVIVCANPPVESKDHQWVSDFAADAAMGKRAAVYLEFNALKNPHIDRTALLAMSAELDERTYAIEVLGQFRGPKDAVAYNWLRLENEIPVPPDYIDVTAQFLAEQGEGPGIEVLAGLDVQRFPYIGGPLYRFYVPPGTITAVDTVCAWVIGEVVLEGGDEVDYCEGLREIGCSPSTTLIICDATGEYQHSRRRITDETPPEWSGRGSFSVIKGEGYHRIKPPDKRMRRKNPAIVDRVRAFTSMIASSTGKRRLFADPELAPLTCKAIREWKTLHGTPSRTQDVAHLGDGASYPIVRLFPRRLRSEARSKNPRPVDPIALQIDRVPAISAAPRDLRVVPPARGPRTGRRGGRTQGL